MDGMQSQPGDTYPRRWEEMIALFKAAVMSHGSVMTYLLLHVTEQKNSFT